MITGNIVVGARELNKAEKALLERAELFWSGEEFSLAQLPVQAFNQGFEKWKSLALSLADSLQGSGRFSSGLDPKNIFYRDFEELVSDRAFTGSGSAYLKKGNMELFNENLYDRFLDSPVELSFWLYVDHRTDNMPRPALFLRDQKGTLVNRERLNSREVHNADGMWVRIAKDLVPEPGINYQLSISGKKKNIISVQLPVMTAQKEQLLESKAAFTAMASPYRDKYDYLTFKSRDELNSFLASMQQKELFFNKLKINRRSDKYYMTVDFD